MNQSTNRRAKPGITPEGKKRALLPYVIGAAAVALLAAVPASLAWGFLHPPRRFHRRTPLSARGLAYRRVRLRTADGVSLSGWFIPPPVSTKEARGVIVLCHGYYSNRSKMLTHAAFLHAAGYATLLFDFRAHGWSSSGSGATFGRDEPLDLTAALDWVEKQPVWGKLPLALFGESMGASVALLVAAGDDRVNAVIADSPYARFDMAVKSRLKIAFGSAAARLLEPSARRAGERILGLALHEIAPVEAIRRIAPRPVLLIHGTADIVVNVENSRLIHAAAPDTSTLWEVEGVSHVESVYDAGPEYARRVVEFLNEKLSGP